MWLALLLIACKGRGEDTPTPEDTGERIVPEVTADRMSVLGHAQECQQALGPIPAFDCVADTQPVPAHADGAPITTNTAERCDKPSLLESSCNPFTRAGRKQGTWMNGDARPEVTFVFTCRSYDSDPPTDAGGLYHDIAMIGHNAITGATCYFQSFPEERIRYMPSPLTAGSTPDLGAVDANDVWDRPAWTADIRCHRCHGADPWIHSPWIDQLRDPENPTEPLVPWTDGATTPYHVVGTAFAGWELEHFALPQNACLACHRVAPGQGCRGFVNYAVGASSTMPLTDSARQYPVSHWMPPEVEGTVDQWEATWRPHVDELLACCQDPDAPACNRTPTPPGTVYVDPDAGTDTAGP